MTLSRLSPSIRSALRLTPLVLALGLSSAVRAQSLAELYDAARGYDATYLGVKAQAESAKYKAEQAYALRRPSVGLDVSTTRSNSDTPYLSTLASHQTDTRAALKAQQNLFNRPNDLQIAQAERGVQVAEAQLRAAEQDLIVRVAQAYFDVLAAQDTLLSAQTNKTAITEQLASAKRNFEVGTATITDTREAQARFDLATAQEIAADNDLRTKRAFLAQLVGRPAVEPKPLAQPAVLPPVTDSAEQWVNATEANSPAVEQARLGYEVAKLETEKARAGHLPTVALTGSYARNHASITGEQLGLTGSAVGFDTSGNGKTSSIGVTLSVPLFAGYSIQNRVKETLSLEEKAREDLENARRSVAQSTRAAFFGVQSGQARVKALEAAEASSQLALEATQLGYKVGVRVNLDVLNAQTQLYNTRTDLAKGRYDVIVGNLKLRQATGQLRPEDVNAANTLLAK
ncbi:MAG TPA: TolC family outer membrane protein [Burkholderiaceae bacterium]|jgi:outer membrane protein|nr:TolC family outer membrane protein [Burkholderiaceae bacterium]